MNSLSEQTPTTATHRLLEDQDLLERSTKKPKHFRGAPMASPHHPTEDDMQDSPVASGGATPDSGQADQDDNESTRRARTVFKQTPPEKYGSWMLVTKQKRGNRPRAQNQNVEVAAKYTTRTEPRQNFSYLGNNGPDITRPTVYPRLPQIRTNSRSQAQPLEQRKANANQRVHPQQHNPGQPSSRGDPRDRATRGGPPNRAAAEAKHTVVRGSNKGKAISTTVLH
nr:uncharacterized protein LOC109175482 [Ipomoea batatas]